MSSLFRRACLIASVACAASVLTAAEFDHVHLNVADPKVATEWYAKNLGGRAIDNNSVAFGRVTIRFIKATGPVAGSVTSAIDHIGFAYPDIAAKMRELAASDVEIVSGIEEEGPIKYAFVRDRWNTLLEIVEDAEITGFHHIHIATTDPKATLAWYKDSLGGERSRFAGVLPGIRYRDGWLLAKGVKEARATTKGRSIDHVGWSVHNASELATGLKSNGLSVERPIEEPDGTTCVFLAAPAGERIELVEAK